MTVFYKKRLYFIIIIIVGCTFSITFALFALKQNINLFYTPHQIISGQAPINTMIRAGGFIKHGSLKYSEKNSLDVNFIITDEKYSVKIQYHGLLPDLLREGQGIVARGKLNINGIFIAEEVLAKHDENYIPIEIGKKNNNLKNL